MQGPHSPVQNLTHITVLVCEQSTLRATSNHFQSSNGSLPLEAHACQVTSAVSQDTPVHRCDLGCRIRDCDCVVL